MSFINLKKQKNIKKGIIVSKLFGFCFLLVLPSLAHSHPGRLDSNGCHSGSHPYHCHRSQSEMEGSRLRCDLGSKSKECIDQTNDKRDDFDSNEFLEKNQINLQKSDREIQLIATNDQLVLRIAELIRENKNLKELIRKSVKPTTEEIATNSKCNIEQFKKKISELGDTHSTKTVFFWLEQNFKYCNKKELFFIRNSVAEWSSPIYREKIENHVESIIERLY